MYSFISIVILIWLSHRQPHEPGQRWRVHCWGCRCSFRCHLPQPVTKYYYILSYITIIYIICHNMDNLIGYQLGFHLGHNQSALRSNRSLLILEADPATCAVQVKSSGVLVPLDVGRGRREQLDGARQGDGRARLDKHWWLRVDNSSGSWKHVSNVSLM